MVYDFTKEKESANASASLGGLIFASIFGAAAVGSTYLPQALIGGAAVLDVRFLLGVNTLRRGVVAPPKWPVRA